MKHHFLSKEDYIIKKSTLPQAGKGAFTNIYLPKGTVLGEYRGKKLTKKQYNSLNDQSYVWELSSPKGVFYIDAKPIKKNNWLRYLNDSRKSSKNNVEEYQYRGKVFYRTTKNIKPGSELFVYYGEDYFD